MVKATGMINKACKSGWNDNYTNTVAYWTLSHGRGPEGRTVKLGGGGGSWGNTYFRTWS